MDMSPWTESMLFLSYPDWIKTNLKSGKEFL
jgi:hypothetical protein